MFISVVFILGVFAFAKAPFLFLEGFMRILEKLIALFCILVLITFLSNHGKMNFSGIDWIRQHTSDAISSETGQSYLSEIKEISVSILTELLEALKHFITDRNAEETSDIGEYSSVCLNPDAHSDTHDIYVVIY